MMNLLKALLVTISLVLIIGCSTKPERPEHYFSTNISADGTKQFALTIQQQERSKTKRNRRGKGEGKGNKGARDDRGEGQDRLITLLERELDRTNFCSVGYQITERYRREGNLLIRGQCNEKAK